MKKTFIVIFILAAAISLRFTWDRWNTTSLRAESVRIEKLTPSMDLVIAIPPTSAWIWHGRIIAKKEHLFSIDCTGDNVEDFLVHIPLTQKYLIGEKVKGSVRFPIENENTDAPAITSKDY